MRQLSTASLSNQNIATRLLLGTYTADADRALVVRVHADQVAGAGAYVCDVTIQRLGSGSAYQVQPTTSVTVASGITAVAFVSIVIPVKNTDVVKVYLTGLAGDTTTPDTVVEWWEDDGVDVAKIESVDATDQIRDAILSDATRFAGADVATIKGYVDQIEGYTDSLEASAATLAGYVDTVETVLAQIKAQTDLLPSDPADQSIIAGYVDTLEASAAAAAAALVTIQGYTDTLETAVATLPSAATVADAVWDEALSGHTTAGSAGKALSDAGGGGVDYDAMIAALAAAGYTVVDTDSVSSSAVSKRRGDLWTVAFTDLGALGTWTKLWFTIKTGDTGDADTDAKVQILLTNPTAGTDGLQRLNGAAATAAQGGIVVDDSATGDITVTVASAATTQLAVRSDYVFDVQILRAAGTTTLAYGTFTVRSDVTRAVS